MNLRLKAAEYDWLARRAQRLSEESGVEIKPTAVAHSFIKRAIEEESGNGKSDR